MNRPYTRDKPTNAESHTMTLQRFAITKQQATASILQQLGSNLEIKTDFFVEYKDEKGHWRNYFPDFIIRLKGTNNKPGKCLIVEIKSAQWETTIIASCKAARRSVMKRARPWHLPDGPS